jgi:hypothetical protein
MKQPPPPILEYRKPSGGSPAPHRPKAVRHALGAGVVCALLSSIYGTATLGYIQNVARGPLPPNTILTLGVAALNALAFLFCGILYIVASYRIRVPNGFWERILVITCGSHFLVVLLMIVCGYWVNERRTTLDATALLTFCINVPMLLVLGHLFLLACYTRWRCG